MVIEAVNGPVVQNGTGFIQRGGRNAGGQHEPHVYRQILRGLKHIFDAVGAHDVGDFVRIGHNGSGAVGQDGLHEFCGADQRAFQMDVGIQKTGEDDFAGAVHFLPAVVAAHAALTDTAEWHIARCKMNDRVIDTAAAKTAGI